MRGINTDRSGNPTNGEQELLGGDNSNVVSGGKGEGGGVKGACNYILNNIEQRF